MDNLCSTALDGDGAIMILFWDNATFNDRDSFRKRPFTRELRRGALPKRKGVSGGAHDSCHFSYYKLDLEPNDMTIRKVIQHGTALAVVIPAAWCRQLDLTRGTYVYLEVGSAGVVLIAKIPSEKVEALRTVQLERNDNKQDKTRSTNAPA